MLQAVLSVNFKKIDELTIVRIKGGKGEMCRYRVEHDDGVWEVDHHYDDGALELVRKAIEAKPDENPCPNCDGQLNAMGRCAKCMVEFARRNA